MCSFGKNHQIARLKPSHCKFARVCRWRPQTWDASRTKCTMPQPRPSMMASPIWIVSLLGAWVLTEVIDDPSVRPVCSSSSLALNPLRPSTSKRTADTPPPPTNPSGFREELLGPLREAHRARPLSGVLVSLHGAMVAEGCDDTEGDLLAAMRAIVGPAVPIVATLDLHCNITRRMAAAVNCLTLYLTVPHVDMYETGMRGARALQRLLDGARVVTAYAKLPLVLPAERANTQATPQQLRDGQCSAQRVAAHAELVRLETLPWVLSAGISTTQPWLSVEEMGSSVLIVAQVCGWAVAHPNPSPRPCPSPCPCPSLRPSPIT